MVSISHLYHSLYGGFFYISFHLELIAKTVSSILFKMSICKNVDGSDMLFGHQGAEESLEVIEFCKCILVHPLVFRLINTAG